jgi:hypothetical protein
MDPIAFDAGDANLYRAMGNNPTNAIDPSGLQVRAYPNNPGISITTVAKRRCRRAKP